MSQTVQGGDCRLITICMLKNMIYKDFIKLLVYEHKLNNTILIGIKIQLLDKHFSKTGYIVQPKLSTMFLIELV